MARRHFNETLTRCNVLLGILSILFLHSCQKPGPGLAHLPKNRPIVKEKISKTGPKDPAPAVVQALKNFRQQHPTASVAWDDRTGHIKQLSGFIGPTEKTAKPEDAALKFLTAHPALFGLDRVKTTLRVEKISLAPAQKGETPVSRSVRFRQVMENVPVYQGTIDVNLTPSNSIYAVYNSLHLMSTMKGGMKLGQKEAMDIAKREIKDKPVKPAHEKIEKIIYPLNDTGIRSWKVNISHWLVILDGDTGEILLLQDEARYGPDALVFSENPVVNNGVPTVMPITNLGAATTLCGSRFCITNLTGEIEVSPVQEFRDPVTDVNFNDQMAYYHLEKAQTFFNGLDVADPPGQIMLYSQDLNLACNAYYEPHWGYIDVGFQSSGCDVSCRPPGHYADILYHEFTHYIIDKEVGLNYNNTESGAIHEGTADYYSDSILGNSCTAEGFMNNEPCLRDSSENKIYPKDMSHEPHDGGEVWASALWDLRKRLGANMANRIIRQGMVTLPPFSNFNLYAGNIIVQGVAYYGNFLSDDAWANIIILIAMGAVQEEGRNAFCAHGIAAPYGPWETLAVTIPAPGATVSGSISVPAGKVVDTARGCNKGYDVIAPGGWEDMKYFLDNKSKLAQYTENVTNGVLTVTMTGPGGCDGLNPIRLNYYLYYK